MAAESEGGHGPWREGVDTLLPAAVLVLGLQAWRAGLTFLPGGGVVGLLAAVVFLAVPAARLLGHLLGARRAAGLLALALAGTRLGIQLGGPAAAPAYGIAGTALMAGYLELWSTNPAAGRRLWSWLLGLHLHLVDRLLSDTLDFLWLPGTAPLVFGLVLTIPVLALAAMSLAGPNLPPRQAPAALAMPLLLALLAILLHHPARVAALTGWNVPAVLMLMAAGAFLAALLLPTYDGLHAGLLHRKARARRARGLLTALTALFTSLVAAGLVWRWLLPVAVLVGPLFLTLPMLALWRARPVGRRRLVGEWSSLPAWWLALAAQVEGLTFLWPVALAGGVLVALGLVAAWHPERPAEAPPATPLWPRLLCCLPLLLAAATMLRFQARPDDLRQAVPQDVFRLLAIDQAPGQPRELPARLAELRDIGAQVILLDTPLAPAGHDAGYWLARRLGLVARADGSGGQILARARPAYVIREQGIPVAIWRYGGSALAIARPAQADSAALARAYEAVTAFPRRAVVAQATVPARWRPPGDSRLGQTVATRGANQLLLLGPGLETLAPPQPPVLAQPGLSALLAVTP